MGGSKPGMILLSRECLATPLDILMTITSGQRAGMLRRILQCTRRRPPHNKELYEQLSDQCALRLA